MNLNLQAVVDINTFDLSLKKVYLTAFETLNASRGLRYRSRPTRETLARLDPSAATPPSDESCLLVGTHQLKLKTKIQPSHRIPQTPGSYRIRDDNSSS
jgi:hypothetical protein